ncbi:ATP-dependent helicase HrpA [Herbihabitans rhizosphaerae]|uniref:RNA helicase n=1 Tax=Herbihabitans rhizosphaerae TaxID=1872711 RepID=A0A4Q7KK23_9PSEU|nr:ATP-dependent RNA helicase HrpA [Herbihabitans rhizosphaerae]RZS36557.1 ATP-dependent helicase HrpA [Herbihabitans rhizosphaerae]
MGSPKHDEFGQVRSRLPELMSRDRVRLRRRLEGARKIRDDGKRAGTLAKITADVEQAEQRVRRRRAALPKITYPEQLPIAARRAEIKAAIRDHQVVIVAGETGSGKTTQLPKMCLELGRGVLGTIGHTQPRRLAARTVADRVAEELGTELGEAVGFKVRFTDKIGDNTLVKLMTDGILLTELQHDRNLHQYDTLIIDEAHERSLNIDFILGYLKQLLPRRPDLKVIITSATIDPERFSQHFGDAPIVEVSGRTYPVEVRYRPLVEEYSDGEETIAVERDQTQAISDAVDELAGEAPGDVLVFLSGEREIRDTADALNARNLRNTEVVPLYARLSVAEQHRVFQPHAGRRIVLATNVAETSLTVPGIKYVIDPGTARISRYSNRTKVQRLPIEPVSQASANQRKGRCGRTSDGICVRLYSEEDFEARPEFTDPEILRTNLASVILQMTAIGLGDIAAFPFVQPPDARNINDGIALLHELGALEQSTAKSTADGLRLTPLGRKVSALPIDPRLARMVLEADRNGCAREVMVIAAALSIQDPRERPAEHQQAADQKHARFADPDSDLIGYLNLWRYLRERQKALSSNQFRKLCRTEFLNYLRVREWQDLVSQLRQVAATVDVKVHSGQIAEEPDAVRIHQSLLAGMLSHVGLKDTAGREYLGARNAKFVLWPGSTLARKQPRWVMAAELVETSRLWGRLAAKIDPEWIEPLAEHLVKRTYSEPHWEKKRGAVAAIERVTLFGLPVVANRKVNYGKIDPEVSRELFIRHALVEGEWETRHRFFHRNRELLDEIGELENRARRRDILVDEDTLFEFYDQRVGKEVVSARHFDTWWKKARGTQPELLTFDRSMLVNAAADEVGPEAYPDRWSTEGLALRLDYEFEPGADDDGVTLNVPIEVLNQVAGDGLAWHVPGLRRELVTALIRSLPKALRRNFVPVPEHAEKVLAQLGNRDVSGSVLDSVASALTDVTGIVVPTGEWRLDAVPEHLKVTYRITSGGKELAHGKDLGALKSKLAERSTTALSRVAQGIERTGLTVWTIGELPKTFERTIDGQLARGYPSLVDSGDTVAVRVLASEVEQRRRMWRGTRRLLLLNTPSPVKALISGLDQSAKLVLSRNPHGSIATLLDDVIDCATDALIAAAGGPAWDQRGFDRLLAVVRAGLVPTAQAVLRDAENVLGADAAARAKLSAVDRPREAVADVRKQLDSLVYNGFVADTGAEQLPELLRYLQAARIRLDKVNRDAVRDVRWMADVHAVQRDYDDLRADLPERLLADDRFTKIRWMIEELRVSYFAQDLRTPYPVSVKRIHRAMDDLEADR